MKRVSFLAIAALAGALLLPGAAMPAIYRWADEKGVIHYSDTLPYGRPFTSLPEPPAQEPRPPVDWRGSDEAFARRHQERMQALEAAQERRYRELELDGIARGAGTPVPGETFVESDFQRRVLGALVQIEHSVAPACSRHAVIDTKVVGRDDEGVKVVERWTVERCGERIDYRIDFSPMYPRRHMPTGTYVVVDARSSFTITLESPD